MDMYQKRELRVKKKQEDSNNDKSLSNVNINWEICIYANTPLNPYK